MNFIKKQNGALYHIPGSALELVQLEVVNKTSHEGAVELQPLDAEIFQFTRHCGIWDRKVRKMRLVQGHWVQRKMQLQMLQGKLRMKLASEKYGVHYLSLIMPRYLLAYPLFSGGSKNSVSSQSFHALRESIFAFLLQRHQVLNKFSVQHPFF
jgi:hypothetical protein